VTGKTVTFITVVIPAYNAEGTIGRAVDSVFLQNYPAFEIIVIDDASRDRTSEIVAGYERDEIRLLRLAKNLGECGAMNEGIAVARGQFIAFLDADDEWLPGKLARQIPLLEGNPKAVLVTCACRFLDEWGNIEEDFGFPPAAVAKDQIWRTLLRASCIAKPCVVARTSALRQLGLFDTSLRISGDQDMWIRLAQTGEVEFVDEILTVSHGTPGSLTRVHGKESDRYGLAMILRHVADCREMLTDIEVRAILSERYGAVGRKLYREGRLVRGGQLLARAMMLGDRCGQNLWYLITASPPARRFKQLLGRGVRTNGPAGPRRADSSLLAPSEQAVAQLSPGRPILIATVDAEAEFPWGTYSRSHTGVKNLQRQAPAQDIFDRFGVRPTYFVDYAVATQPEGFEPLCRIAAAGHCEIGAHLESWQTPPFDEELSGPNSYNHNLPAWLQKEKLSRLTEAIVANFGIQPLSYRAGRYGVGEEIGWILAAFGYRIDMSVRPGVDLHRHWGPDFRRSPATPYWFGPARSLLEIPLTVGLVGLLGSASLPERLGPAVYTLLSQPGSSRTHLPGALARLGVLERIALTPEGTSLRDMQRLTRALHRRGHRVFVLSYHSSSLLPGGAPYVRSAEDLSRFLATLAAYLEFFFEELGGVATTPSEFYARLPAARAADPSPDCLLPAAQ
jgi:hypothetical protein